MKVALNQRFGGLWLRVGSRYWTRQDARSLAVFPGGGGRIGPVDLTGSYRLYRTTRGNAVSSTHTVDLSGAFSILDDVRITLGGQRQWGANLSGVRAHIGFWRAF